MTAQFPVKLTIDNSNVMRSHESAYLSIKSPTGKVITIRKSRLTKMTDAQSQVWWKFNDREMTRDTA